MIVLFIYLIVAAATFFLIGKKAAAWDLGKTDAVGLGLLWPFFYLIVVDWGFGDLVDKGHARLFRKKS